MLSFGNKVNRSFGIYLPFQDGHTEVQVFFHKSSTFIGFVTDRKIYNMCESGEAKSTIYKDLKQSSFATTFLDISTFKSPNLDVRNQFSNVLNQYKAKIQYVANETVKLAKIKTDNGNEYESCLFLYVFSFSDYEGDFLYCLAERQHIDIALGKKLVRTSALQISTTSCLEDMRKMVEYYNGKQEVNLTDTGNTNSGLKDLFPDRESVDIRRM